jgi:formylglycine-generating enzyme required for sulfatase activity
MKLPSLITLFNPRGLRTALTCLALIFAASAPGLGRLGAQDATAAIRQAKGFLEEDKFLDGLAAAQEAVRAAPQNYLGHYYVAYAQLGLSQYESAAAAANQALTLAPADSKEGVAKLVEAIKLRSQAGGITKAAEEALSEGLNAKAARLYEQAWNAGRDNPELGLKAAEIYMGALKQPLEAGRVLQQVRRVATGTAGARVVTMLQQIAAPLRAQAQELVKQAKASRDLGEQTRLLDRAEEADPSYAALHDLRVRVAVKGTSEAALLSALKGLARNKLATIDAVRSLPNLGRWLAVPAINEYLTDLFGAQEVAALARGGGGPAEDEPITLRGVANLKLMPIAAGRFAMGSTNGEADEKPVTDVTINQPYWLGQTEVTQGQWEAVMGNNPSGFKGANLPVETVSYDEALAFCRKVTEQERAAGRLAEGYEYTLPTEAQWEYACRAGTTGDYAGNLDAMAWYDGNSGSKTHAVGGKQANEWGLYDMHGNVWEWCLDWYGNYAGGSVTDPRSASSGSSWVYRGGGWGNSASYCRAAFRYRNSPGNRLDDLGFRLALSSVR